MAQVYIVICILHLWLGNLTLELMDLPAPLQGFLLSVSGRTAVIVGDLPLLICLLDHERFVDPGTLSYYLGYHDRWML